MAERLLLVRHGACEGGGEGRLIGTLDVPLTEHGERQAELLARRLCLPEPAHVLCSPLRRARQTAAAVLGGNLGGIEIDEDLREVNVGAWEGRPVAELAAEYPEEMSRWAAWDQSFVFPGGETLAGFLARIDALAGRLLRDPAPAVVCFSHAGVIRALMCRVLRLPTDSYVAFDVRPAATVVFDVHGDAGVLRSLLNLEDEEWRMWS